MRSSLVMTVKESMEVLYLLVLPIAIERIGH